MPVFAGTQVVIDAGWTLIRSFYRDRRHAMTSGT